MTIEDIANYCEFKDCSVYLGDPESGFIAVDGTGLEDRSYTYGRFRMLHEVSALPSPPLVVAQASIFKVRRGETTRTLNRAEFELELHDLQSKLGLA